MTPEWRYGGERRSTTRGGGRAGALLPAPVCGCAQSPAASVPRRKESATRRWQPMRHRRTAQYQASRRGPASHGPQRLAWYWGSPFHADAASAAIVSSQAPSTRHRSGGTLCTTTDGGWRKRRPRRSQRAAPPHTAPRVWCSVSPPVSPAPGVMLSPYKQPFACLLPSPPRAAHPASRCAVWGAEGSRTTRDGLRRRAPT